MASNKLRKFLDVYSLIPLPERRNTISVINGEPISWEMAYKEIRNDSELGDRIFDKMVRLRILEEVDEDE